MYSSTIIGFLIVTGLFIAILFDPVVYQYLNANFILMTAAGTVGFLLIAYPFLDLMTLPFTALHILLVPPFIDRYWLALFETPPNAEFHFQMSEDDLKIIDDMKQASGMFGSIKYIVLLTSIGGVILNVSKPLQTLVPSALLVLFVFLLCFAAQTKLEYLSSLGERLQREYPYKP